MSVSNYRRRIAYLAAFCLFLSTIEFLIPKPFPFMRIGLANLPLLISLEFFGFAPFALLVALKILGQGLVNGTLFSYIFLFSLAGSLVSAFAMYFSHLFLKRWISLIGVSLIGAMFSNIAQLSVGALLVFGHGVWSMAPPFMIIGFISGIVLGIIAEKFKLQSQWVQYCRKENYAESL